MFSFHKQQLKKLQLDSIDAVQDDSENPTENTGSKKVGVHCWEHFKPQAKRLADEIWFSFSKKYRKLNEQRAKQRSFSCDSPSSSSCHNKFFNVSQIFSRNLERIITDNKSMFGVFHIYYSVV